MTIVLMLIALGAFLFVIMPLLDETSRAAEFGETSRDAGPLLEQIEDLELEHAAGKLPDDIYARVRGELVSEAAEILEKRPE